MLIVFSCGRCEASKRLLIKLLFFTSSGRTFYYSIENQGETRMDAEQDAMPTFSFSSIFSWQSHLQRSAYTPNSVIWSIVMNAKLIISKRWSSAQDELERKIEKEKKRQPN